MGLLNRTFGDKADGMTKSEATYQGRLLDFWDSKRT